MQRWYTQPEETVVNKPLTPVPSPPQPQQYAPEMVHRAVEIAAQMQAEHQETLSAEEIEAIAAEAGIDPRFIRQALVQAEAEVQTATLQLQTIKRPVKRRLSRRNKALIFGLPLLYALIASPIFMLLINLNKNDSTFWPWIFLCYLPGLLTFLTGIVLKRLRQAFLGGGLMGFAVFLALFIALLVCRGGDINPGDPNMYIAWGAFVAVGAFVGLTAASMRRLYSHLRKGVPSWLGDEEHPAG